MGWYVQYVYRSGYEGLRMNYGGDFCWTVELSAPGLRLLPPFEYTMLPSF